MRAWYRWTVERVAGMRHFTLVFVLAGTLTAAQAQPRVSTQSLTCVQARALVSSRGAVVLNTGPVTYERFVASSAFCDRGETIEPAWVRTADAAQCFIAYRCIDANLEMDR
jgi:hypothetical protein